MVAVCQMVPARAIYDVVNDSYLSLRLNDDAVRLGWQQRAPLTLDEARLPLTRGMFFRAYVHTRSQFSCIRRRWLQYGLSRSFRRRKRARKLCMRRLVAVSRRFAMVECCRLLYGLYCVWASEKISCRYECVLSRTVCDYLS